MFLSEVILIDILHLGENYARQFIRRVVLGLLLVQDLGKRLNAVLVDERVRKFLNVRLHWGVRKSAADEGLDIEHGVNLVNVDLIYRWVTDDSLRGSVFDVEGCGTVSLKIRDGLKAVILADADS